MSTNIKSTSPYTTSVQNCFTTPASTGPLQTTGSVSSSKSKFTLITGMPVLLTAGIRKLSSPVAFSFMPNALGMLGPVMSASIIALLKPLRFISTAKSEVIMDFPTPPFPLTTPITLLI